MESSGPTLIKDRSLLKSWHTVYPAYLEKGFTLPQGRRVPKEVAVEKPKLEEMSAVLEFLKIRHCIEYDKAYPRDWLTKGRVRVLLKDEHGQLMHPVIESSERVNFREAADAEDVRADNEVEVKSAGARCKGSDWQEAEEEEEVK